MVPVWTGWNTLLTLSINEEINVMQVGGQNITLKSTVSGLKTFFIDNHMVIFAMPILLGTIMFNRLSRERELSSPHVVNGLVVSCRQGDRTGHCFADIEFRMGEARVRKRSVKLQKGGHCLVGQTVKVQYSLRSKQIDIIE